MRNAPAWVIGMWHLEDLLRAHRFDAGAVEDLLIAPGGTDEPTREHLRAWYGNIMQRMREEGLEKRGHLAEVEEVVNELEFLHAALLGVLDDADYDALWEKAAPGVKVLRERAEESDEGTVFTCLTAVYGVLVLRAKGRTINPATLEAEGHIRRMLDALGERYSHMRRLPGISLN